MTTYDNLDEATDTQQYLYQGDPADLQGDMAAQAAAATPATLDASDVLLAWTYSSYDNLGRVYQTSSTGSTRRVAARSFPIPGMMPTATPSIPPGRRRARSSPRLRLR